MVSAVEHAVKLTAAQKAGMPDVFVLACVCGWRAEVTGVESARAAAVAHEDRRSDG